MKLKHRAWAFFGVFLIGGPVFAVAVATVAGERSAIVPVAALSWFAVFAVLQFVLLKCPHCGRAAIIKPSGVATPSVGDRCRHCGKEY